MQASTLFEPLLGFKGGEGMEQDLVHFIPTGGSSGVAVAFVDRQVRIISELSIGVCHGFGVWLWQAVLSARMRNDSIGSDWILCQDRGTEWPLQAQE
jgi:hypothetical protein